jgi:hypothetical protein
MNTRYRESEKKRSRNSSTAIPRSPVRAAGKPIAFARQLSTAAGHRPAIAPRPRLSARLLALLLQIIQRLTRQFVQRRHRRRKLELLEIQQLGEKRFVAIVRVGKQKFLIGGAAASVSLLAEIDAQRATVIAARPLGQESA